MNEEDRRYRNALALAAEVIDCGIRDIEEILSMEERFPKMIERAVELAEDMAMKVNFGHFVLATQEQAIKEIEDEISEDLADLLREVIIDDNYSGWGSLAYAPEELPEELANAFVSYVRGQQSKEEFIKVLKEVMKR